MLRLNECSESVLTLSEGSPIQINFCLSLRFGRIESVWKHRLGMPLTNLWDASSPLACAGKVVDHFLVRYESIIRTTASD